MPKGHRRILTGIILIGLAIRLGMIWVDFGLLTCGLEVLQDDSVINFVYARNISEGKGVTFEPGQPVFGFHPPSVLFLLPFFRLFPGEKIIPIQCLLTLYAFVSLATTLLVYRIVRRAAGDQAALLSGGVWALGYGVAVYALCGSDAPVTIFLMAVAIDYYLRRVQGVAAPPIRSYAMLGVLCGLCIYARMDAALLLPAFGLDIILSNRRDLFRTGIRKILVAGTAMALAVALVSAPFFFWQKHTFGSIQLHSAATCRGLSAVMGHYVRTLGLSRMLTMMKNSEHGNPLDPVLTELDDQIYPVWGGLYLFCSAKAVAVLFAKYGDIYLPLAAISCLVLVHALRQGKGDRLKRLRAFYLESGIGKLNVVLLYAAMHFSIYVFYQFSYWHLARYMYPLALAGVLHLGPAAVWWLNRVLPAVRPRIRLLPGVLAGWLFACFLIFCGQVYANLYKNRCEGGNGFIQAAEWINRNTPRDAIIGFYQSGYFGYFLDRDYRDLGGKATAEAWDAWFNRREWDYIQKTGLDYILDEDHYLDFLFAWGKMYPIEDRLELVNQEFGRRESSRILIFKVKKGS